MKINCYVVSLKLCLPTIKLADNDSINHLKQAIHDATSSSANVRASDFLLYQVKPAIDIIHTQDLDADVEALFSNGEPVKEKLKPLRVISSLLSLHPQNLHIVAQVPQIVPPATLQVTLSTAPHIALPTAAQIALPPPVPQIDLPALPMAPPAVLQAVPPTVQDLRNFILSATLPSYSVTMVNSVSTRPYATIGNTVKSVEEVPGFLTQDPSLLQRMHDDLVSNYLPRYTRVDSELFLDSRLLLRMLIRGHSNFGLSNEASVWQVTDKCLTICVTLMQSLGLQYNYQAEARESLVSVVVDRLIKEDGNEFIAWEDKSPTVFQKHCTQIDIQLNAGKLDIREDKEEGFRAILFKLSLFMLKRKIRWGVLHDGTTMYVVRTERKQSKPSIVISSPLSMDATTGPTPIALICYMMLSRADGVNVVDPGIADDTPASSAEGHSDSFDDTGDNGSDGGNNRDDDDDDKADDHSEGGVSPDSESLLHTTNLVIIDLPALSNRVKISMSRLPPLTHTASNLVHLLATSFIGAGGFGRVFKAVICRPGSFETGLVIKLAQPGRERELEVEAEAYTRLGELAGRITPAFYGLFTGTSGQWSGSMLVLSYNGKSLSSFDDLSKSARLSILLKIYQVHQAGIQLNDVKPDNVVQNETGYYLIDFSVAWTDHKCLGITKCHELLSVMNQLQVTVGDCTEAGLVLSGV